MPFLQNRTILKRCVLFNRSCTRKTSKIKNETIVMESKKINVFEHNIPKRSHFDRLRKKMDFVLEY
jgi:hypothetical protein